MPATAAATYPTLPRLKSLYPIVGVKLLPTDDGRVKALKTVNGKAISSVIFSGKDEAEVESNVFRLWHWEKTHKRLPLPFSIAGASKPRPAPVAVAAPAAPVVKAERVPNPAGLTVNGGTIWAHHPVHGTKRHKDTTKEALTAAGWTIGRPKR